MIQTAEDYINAGKLRVIASRGICTLCGVAPATHAMGEYEHARKVCEPCSHTGVLGVNYFELERQAIAAYERQHGVMYYVMPY